MSSEVVLPTLPLGGDEITVVRWLRQQGDPVAPGEALLVAANERVEVALPSMAGGTLAEILAREGSVVRPGAVLARFDTPAAVAPAPRATPLARRIAAVHGLDLTTLVGSGPGGRVMKCDVLAPDHLSASAPAADQIPAPTLPATPPAAPEATPAIATQPYVPSMVQLEAVDSAHILTAIEVDLSAAEVWLARQGGQHGQADLLACVVQAAVAALLRFPLLNAAWHDEGIITRRRVHLAVQHARSGQTNTISIPNAQDLNLRGLTRALTGHSQPNQEAATFTIVAGDRWSTTLTPPVGQSGLLGLGTVVARPVVVGSDATERISIRPTALLTLAFDTRVLDQPQADAYLTTVRRSLEQLA